MKVRGKPMRMITQKQRKRKRRRKKEKRKRRKLKKEAGKEKRRRRRRGRSRRKRRRRRRRRGRHITLQVGKEKAGEQEALHPKHMNTQEESIENVDEKASIF